MRTEGRRQSQNVEDRRALGGARAGIGGGIGILILLLLAWAFGFDPRYVLEAIPEQQQASNEPYRETPEEAQRSAFARVVLADTEDTWTEIFREKGRTYELPTLVLFRNAVDSGCGFAQSAVGPFYCPIDHKVYLDLSFFDDMSRRLGASGDFATAYVIAHEIGHHVQAQLGIMDRVAAAKRRLDESEANALSVRVELQADCLAGVWANRTEKQKKVLEKGDIEEAMNAAAAVGDDRLQRRAQGYVVPESFTHGTSAQRVAWFTRGLQTGDMNQCDTFSGRGT